MTCLEFPTMIRQEEEEVVALSEVAKRNPNPRIPAQCRAFSGQVQRVQDGVAELYGCAAQRAKTASLEETAAIWRAVLNYCNLAIEHVEGLKAAYPDCGTPALYHKLVAYGLECRDRLRAVEEDILCQKTPPPAGLFPSPA